MENGVRFFKKEIPSNPLFLPTGGAVAFEFFDPDGLGFIQTSDSFVISELDRAVDKRVGGVVLSTAEEYADFQKKKEGQPSGRLSPKERETVTAQTLSRFRFRPQSGADAARAAAGANAGVATPRPTPMPERLEVPTAFPTLGTGVL